VADTNWQRIRLAYVRGKYTYKQLAEKYGVSENTLEKRARAENWQEARRKYRGNVAAKAQARAEEADAQRLAALQNAGTDMCNQLEALMRDAKREMHTHVNQFGQAVTVEESVNDRKLLNITRSIETMTRAMRNLYDINTTAQREQMQLAREEMELKRQEQERKARETELKEKEAKEKGVDEIQITYGGVDMPEDYAT